MRQLNPSDSEFLSDEAQGLSEWGVLKARRNEASDAATKYERNYESDGRTGGIWTHDLLHPKQALYRAEPRSEGALN